MPKSTCDRLLPLVFATVAAASFGLLAGGTSYAGEVRLKNGMVFEGQPFQADVLSGTAKRTASGPAAVHPFVIIDTGVQRIFVDRRKVDGLDSSADLGKYESFKLPQHRFGKQVPLKNVGRATNVTAFDKDGRRSLTLTTQHGPLLINQGVTRLAPQYLSVMGLNEDRTLGLWTSEIPPGELDRMLKNAVDMKKPDDRMALARYYLQAKMFQQSAAELESVVRDFPEVAERVKPLSNELGELQAKQLLAELRQRKEVGQHALAYQAAKVFPLEKRSEAITREVRDLIESYDHANERGQTALLQLGQLQAKLEPAGRVDEVMPLRSVVNGQLNFDTLGRLDAFLKLTEDATLKPAEKLALAYSGWVLGSANAITDFDATMRLWKARFLITDYLREKDPGKRAALLKDLKSMESIGPEQIAKLIPLLRPPLESPDDIVPGKPQHVEIPSEEVEMPVSYSVLLPQEYNPDRAYPLIVSLHPFGTSTDEQVRWWGITRSNTTGADMAGQSQRYGYIVIAPDYIDDKQQTYNYGVPSHYIVQESIRDARKRFHVDSDRVFLSGHGMGADAAFDIGMSQPELFAGVIPVGGLIDKYCTWYWQNGEHVAWYIVAGELDRDLLERNTLILTNMMKNRFDVIYVEYVGRGFESYYAEIHRMFEWMNLHKRDKFPKSFKCNVLRPTDDRFYWAVASGFPQNLTQVDILSGHNKEKVQPMLFEGEVTATNSMRVKSGGSRHTVWLAPGLVDFEKKLSVNVRSQPKFNDFVRPDVETMLEDLRVRGDREGLYWARLDF